MIDIEKRYTVEGITDYYQQRLEILPKLDIPARALVQLTARTQSWIDRLNNLPDEPRWISMNQVVNDHLDEMMVTAGILLMFRGDMDYPHHGAFNRGSLTL